MKAPILLAATAVLGCGCASTGPATAWAKAGVSRIDFGTDIGMCTGYASMVDAGNGANTAGGINGQNTPVMERGGDDKRSQSTGGPAPPSGTQTGGGSGAAFPTGGGAYRDSAPTDLVQRAATQQRAQEMARQRARQLTLSNCLVERGYTEIRLTPAQRAELGKLGQGSKEYHEYLYKLGADPAIIEAQAATRTR